jgi:hypothetical protein
VLRDLLDEAAIARTEEAAGLPPRMRRIHPDTAGEARELGRHTYDGWEYYRTQRGAHPRSENWFVARSIDLLAQFHAFDLVALIAPRPLLMIAGTEAVTAYYSQEAIEQAREPRELRWIDGATHVDLYDRDEFVTPVLATLTEFYETHLGRPLTSAIAAGR